MPDANQTGNMREALKKVYPGVKWAKRVNLMPAEQVLAVYLNLKQQGKIK